MKKNIDSQRNWDLFYLEVAKTVSLKSKDPSTKVGAVLARKNRSLISVGFNGFPQAMPDKSDFYLDRKEKYSRIIHAEMNALIYSENKNLKESTLYTWPFSACDRCFVVMVQAGVERFVAPKPPELLQEVWTNSFLKVKEYANECNVELVELDFE